MGILINQIPLVDGDNACLAVVVRIAGNLGVLLGYALLGVYHNENHVTPVNCRKGADNAVTLDVLVNFATLSHSGGVYKDILLTVVLIRRIDGVTGCAGNVADDYPVRRVCG